jgi:predicted amidophosphoribosyltransferase
MDAYDRALEQEALLQQIEERPACPTCSLPIQPNWFLCPSCHTHLRQPCPVCNSPLELHWDICPYCGYLFEAPEQTIEELVDDTAETGSTARPEPPPDQPVS